MYLNRFGRNWEPIVCSYGKNDGTIKMLCGTLVISNIVLNLEIFQPTTLYLPSQLDMEVKTVIQAEKYDDLIQIGESL